MQYSIDELLKEQEYSKEEIRKATLVMHPNDKKYNLSSGEIAYVFEEWSNLTLLENPIKVVELDGDWNEIVLEYRCSEWYYMAQRVKSFAEKQVISFLSTWYWLAMKSRKLFDLDMDEWHRAEYMRNAIREKFNNNPSLAEKLLATGDTEIIEYTYWRDMLFWIDQNSLKGKNVLWKLLEEYRENCK